MSESMLEKIKKYMPFVSKNDKYRTFGTAAVVIILILGVVFICFAYQTQSNVTKQYLTEIVLQSADRITMRLEQDKTIINSTAQIFASEDDIDRRTTEYLLQNEYKLCNPDTLVRLAYVDINGVGIEVNSKNECKKFAIPLNTEYFKEAKESKTLVCKTAVDPMSSDKVLVYAMPIIKNDEVTAVHTGVFHLNKVDNILNVDYFNSSGHSYVIDKNGVDIFLNEHSSSFDFRDFFNETIGVVTSRIAASEHESVIVRYNNKNYWLTYAPIRDTDWYLVLMVPNSSINNRSEQIVIFSVAIILALLLTSVLFLRHMDIMQAENQTELIQLACMDEVSGLFNKTGFSDFLEESLIKSRDKHFAIVYFDLDNFKTFNDIFGYSEGDRLIKHAASVLLNEMRENECCARFSGDNFYALLEVYSQSTLEERVTKIMRQFSDFRYGGDSSTAYDIICHCGIFIISDLHKDKKIDFYVDRAKMALAAGEKTHTNGFTYYDESIRKNLIFETELESDLKQGLENEDFKVYIQPKYNVQTQKLAGGEALIRWQHPTKGFLTPNRFVDVFEKNGQITEIDFFVLERVCRMQREWIYKGYEPVVISVNQSRMHLFKNDYFDRLRTLIGKYGIEPKYIELEITETVALSNSRLLSEAVDKLHDIGFRVSIDDFGSGQSSLNVLKDIEIDVIKLDRAFFIALTNSPKGKEIISSVIGMASRLDIETVSEGIETDEQFDFIKKVGCDLVQGFLFGKPMPLEEYSALFENSFKTK